MRAGLRLRIATLTASPSSGSAGTTTGQSEPYTSESTPRARITASIARGAVGRGVEEDLRHAGAGGENPRGPRAASRCRGARPASIAKHTRRRGCDRPEGGERVPGHVHGRDVAGERGPPRWVVARPAPSERARAGSRALGRDARAAARRGRRGRRAAARSAPCPPRPRAPPPAGTALTKPLSRSSPSSSGIRARPGWRRPTRAAPPGTPPRPRARRRAAAAPRTAGSASMPSGLESATQARSRPSDPTSSARRTGSWSAGSKPHSGSPGVSMYQPSRRRCTRGGSVRRASSGDQRLRPEMLMYVYPQGLVKGFSETFK